MTPHTGSAPTGSCRNRTDKTGSGAAPVAARNPCPLPCPEVQGGFTLLEILVSVLIFSIVITTIFFAYRSLAAGPDRLDDRLAESEMAKMCLDRMVEDLQSLYCTPRDVYSPPGGDDPPDPLRIVGDTLDAAGIPFGRLRFTSLAHVPNRRDPLPGLAEIVYYVWKSGDGTLQLNRSDRLFPYPPFEPSGADPVLCLNVRALEFRYIDAAAELFDSWDSDSADFENATPRAIDIRLEVGTGEQSRVFETRVNLPVYRGNRG